VRVNKDNPNVEVVFTSAMGTIIYALKDVTTISTFRALGAEKARRHSEFCITKDELTKLIQAMKDAVNLRKDFVELMAMVQEMEYRNNFICEENTLMDLACIYYFLEDEDMEMPSDDFNQRKAKLAKAEFDIRSFFLQSALHLTKRFSEQQEKDLPLYLEEIKLLSQKLYRFIQAGL
jgi:hypothetical protein